MKKIMTGVIFAVYTFCVYTAMKKRLGIGLKNAAYSSATFCVPDMLERSFIVARILLVAVLAVILIWDLKPYFRNTVMLQYKSRMAVLWEMYRHCTVLAALLSFFGTVISTVLGTAMADSYSNNWLEKGSFMNIYCGTVGNAHVIPTWESIAIHAAALFLILVTSGFVIIFFWYLSNPVTGIILILAVYAAEVSTAPPVFKILFSYVKIANTGIYYDGVNFKNLFICPLVWCTVFTAANVLLVRRKNLFY